MLDKWTGALVSAVLFALASTASNAQSATIGQATGVKPRAASQGPSGWEAVLARRGASHRKRWANECAVY
jgi:hypothetical protein